MRTFHSTIQHWLFSLDRHAFNQELEAYESAWPSMTFFTAASMSSCPSTSSKIPVRAPSFTSNKSATRAAASTLTDL